MAKSITDYIFRWLALKFLDQGQEAAAEATTPATAVEPKEAQAAAPARTGEIQPGPSARSEAGDGKLFKAHMDSPLCSNCGRMMFPSGACYRCDCGATSGGCS